MVLEKSNMCYKYFIHTRWSTPINLISGFQFNTRKKQQYTSIKKIIIIIFDFHIYYLIWIKNQGPPIQSPKTKSPTGFVNVQRSKAQLRRGPLRGSSAYEARIRKLRLSGRRMLRTVTLRAERASFFSVRSAVKP